MTKIRTKKFAIIYQPQVRFHLRGIPKRDRRWIRNDIEKYLTVAPAQPSRQRDTLTPPLPPVWDEWVAEGLCSEQRPLRLWRLRCGPHNRYRVFYIVDEAMQTVFVIAIGRKVRETLYIAGEIIPLRWPGEDP